MRARDLHATALLALAAMAPAQESRASRPSPVEVARLLESGSASKIAWGAFHARADDVQKALPHLLAALAWLRSVEHGDEWRCAALQVLDVLLSTQVSIREDELGTLLEDGETRRPALALLARDGKANLAFFARLDSEAGAARGDWESLLAGNVLAAQRAPGFAARQLAEIEWRLQLWIRGDDGVGCCGAIVDTSRGTRLRVSDGFPPTPFFRWSASKGDEEATSVIPVAGRNCPVRLSRTVAAGPVEAVFETDPRPGGDQTRIDWLADALGCSWLTLGVEACTWKEIIAGDRAGLERNVADAKAGLLVAHAALVERLLVVGALDAAEAKRARIDPRVCVIDRRKNPQVPLPDFPGVEIVRTRDPRAQDSPESRPSAAAIARMLESGAPERIAWGAFHARASDVKRALPHLMAALGRLRVVDRGDEWLCASLQVLNALFATEAPLSPEELVPFLDHDATRIPALALLARDGRGATALFARLFDDAEARRSEWERLLAGNVLAKARATGFAARLLAEVELRIQVTVVGELRRGGRRGWSTGGEIEELVTVPEGFPPTPMFHWRRERGPNDIALPGQNLQMALGRRLVPHSDGPLEDPGPSRSRRPERIDDFARLAWLADALGREVDTLGIAVVTPEDHAWIDAASYVAAIAAAKRRLGVAHARLAADLVRAGALGGEAAKAVRFEPTVTVCDRRRAPCEHLPVLPGVRQVDR